MSDPLGSRSRARAKQDLGERLRRVRRELYGEHGGPELASLLGIPYRTWANYEGGVTIPGEVLLGLLDLTGVEPRWLLRGEGAAFRSPPGGEAGQQFSQSDWPDSEQTAVATGPDPGPSRLICKRFS
jgi:transcriptional regulator with XRE-family HTH domain